MNIQSATADDLKLHETNAPTGEAGQHLLVSGDQIALRLWDEQPGDTESKSVRTSQYETVGYVLSGQAEVTIEGKTIALEAGSSWIVPQGAEHSYRIIEPFRAVEATHPPARGYSDGQ